MGMNMISKIDFYNLITEISFLMRVSRCNYDINNYKDMVKNLIEARDKIDEFIRKEKQEE